MSLTITIPGAVDVTTGSMAPAVLTIGVGVPGAQGPQGPAGPGVPVGGTAGQYLQKIDGTNYNTDWVTLNLSAYLTTSAAASTYYPLTNPASYITSAALSPYLLSSTAASTYQTIAGMSSYLTTSAAASTYATIAQGQPASGTIGQVLTKNSGTNYDSSWQTLIPGDRYLTSSTTSLTISNANKTLTIGTGLSYTPTQSITLSYDASNHMHGEVLTYNSGTGVLTVDINHNTGSGTYASWVVNVGGVVPATSVTWGSITGTLGSQTDLATALNAKLASADAATTYAPIASPTFTGTVTIPAGASISGFAPLASPALTGNVTITSNSTGAALFIEQAGTGNILTLHDQATDTNFVAIDANGKVSTIPSEATNGAGFNIAHGVAPTTPVNGDIWTTTSGLFARINAATQQFAALSTNNTFSNASSTYGSSTAAGTINVASGATISASTKTVNVATGGVVGSTTLTTIGPVLGASTTSIGGTTAASTLNLATGATLTATTKAVNIGTSGVAGSTTNITIGSTTGTSTTTLQGITNGVTEAVDTNNTELATTAFVVGQAGSATPLVDGTAAVGTSLRYARQDHVHPTDTSRAALASPTFTGVPAAPTAAVDTNTTQLATTAYVVGQGYAKLASPTFTGTPSLPTGTTAVTQTAGNNTTALATTAFVTAAVPAFATNAQARLGQSTTTVLSPFLNSVQSINPSTFAWTTFNSATSGSSAANNNYGQYVYEQDTPLASNAGYATVYSNPQMSWVNGGGVSRLTFTKPVWISGKVLKVGGFAGDANTSYRSYVGNTDTGGLPAGGDPVAASIGIKFTGGASQVFQLMVHNGTSQTLVSGSTTIATDVVYEWMVYSDGAGNATLYINGVQEATTTAAPTATSNICYAVQAVAQTASAATRLIMVNRNVKVAVGN